MPKHVIRFTCEVITDVLRPGSKSRMTRKKVNLERPKAPPSEQNSEKCDDEKQQKYLDLEQRVKAVDSRQTTNESTSEAKDVNAAAATQEAKADETEGSRAADASEASAAGEKILEKRQAAAPEGTAALEKQKKKAKKTKRTGAQSAEKRKGGRGREDYDRCISSSSSDSC